MPEAFVQAVTTAMHVLVGYCWHEQQVLASVALARASSTDTSW